MKFMLIMATISIVLFYGCSPSQKEVNYVGKTRQKIASMCAGYNTFTSLSGNGVKKS